MQFYFLLNQIENRMRDTFEYNKKGILGIIYKVLLRLFINTLNEAKDVKLSIPKCASLSNIYIFFIFLSIF